MKVTKKKAHILPFLPPVTSLALARNTVYCASKKKTFGLQLPHS